jgi:hypothetical protein
MGGNIAHLETRWRLGQYDLYRIAAFHPEYRSQYLVTLHDGFEGTAQRWNIDISRQPPGKRLVVCRVAGVQLVQEPEAFLWKRKRQVACQGSAIVP